MVINLPVSIHSVGVHPGVHQHLNEGDHQREDQPDIHHLHIGSSGERSRDTDECQLHLNTRGWGGWKKDEK